MPDNANFGSGETSDAYPEPEDELIDSGPSITRESIGWMASGEYRDGQHIAYWIRHEYEYATGQYRLPVAASTGDTRIVRLHAPTMIHRVYWACRRVGAFPAMPSPLAPDSNHTLLFAIIRPMSPGLMENLLDAEYAVTGEYHYSMAAPVWDDTNAIAGVSFGVMPWTRMKLADQVIPVGTFIAGLF